MITAVIRVRSGAEALVATLTALVPGVAESVIGDAVVLVSAPDRAVSAIADEMGATLLAVAEGDDPWVAGAGRARHDWLLLIEDGDIFAPGWIGALGRFAALAGADPAWARLDREAPAGKRLRRVIERVKGRPRWRPGDLLRRTLLTSGTPPPARPRRLAAKILRDPAGRS